MSIVLLLLIADQCPEGYQTFNMQTSLASDGWNGPEYHDGVKINATFCDGRFRRPSPPSVEGELFAEGADHFIITYSQDHVNKFFVGVTTPRLVTDKPPYNLPPVSIPRPPCAGDGLFLLHNGQELIQVFPVRDRTSENTVLHVLFYPVGNDPTCTQSLKATRLLFHIRPRMTK